MQAFLPRYASNGTFFFLSYNDIASNKKMYKLICEVQLGMNVFKKRTALQDELHAGYVNLFSICATHLKKRIKKEKRGIGFSSHVECEARVSSQ